MRNDRFRSIMTLREAFELKTEDAAGRLRLLYRVGVTNQTNTNRANHPTQLGTHRLISSCLSAYPHRFPSLFTLTSTGLLLLPTCLPVHTITVSSSFTFMNTHQQHFSLSFKRLARNALTGNAGSPLGILSFLQTSQLLPSLIVFCFFFLDLFRSTFLVE